MKKGRIRFLAEGEAPPLPGWTRLLPAAWREYYTRSRSPYHIEEQAGVWEGILHTRKEGITGDGWRQNATALLDEMRQNGVGIVMPPAEGEFPQEGLPFAEGRKITSVFAFAGAAEALRRKGTEPAQASYLIAGGEPWLWEQAFSSMGNEVNRLSIYTEQKRAAEAVAERLYEECGLLVEVFSSPKNPAFAGKTGRSAVFSRPYRYVYRKLQIYTRYRPYRKLRLRYQQPFSKRSGFQAGSGGYAFFGRHCNMVRRGFYADSGYALRYSFSDL